MTILPQELLDHILDYHHASVSSLSSSSLVSRSWLPTTRYHLFRIPVLYQKSFGRSPRDNTKTFLELLDSPLCTFRHTIQGCVLNIEFRDRLHRCINALGIHTTLTETLLITQYLGDISLTDSLKIPQRFSSIRSFVYSNMSHVWCSDLPQLITSLPHLDSLAIFTNIFRSVRVTLPDFPTMQGQQSFLPNLRRLRLRMANPSLILQWILNHSCYTPQIDTLDIMICHNSSTGWGLVEALEPFLKANSDTLKNLSIGLDYDLDLHHELNDHTIPQLHMGNLPNLRSLTLQTHDIDALRQSTFSLLTGHQSVLDVLTLDLVPFIPVEGSYDEDHFRAILGECLNIDFSNKVKSLRVNILCPVIPCDRGYLGLAQTLSVGLLPKWEHIGKLEVRIIRGRKWQVDSVEYINRRIWGSADVPYTEKFTRIGTL
ncbi:hypothetical protein C8J55DRAFT_604194 [Lentinula edodes]|uniref:F-box domain-containing protein n=1 Tax=Lentinula lateritia TaxID=40482 RepID=A0A9W9DWS2_9AGAR|nr:hypothetical protein C8J55DRAFT_604194 [Lentinula edodes]